MGWGFFASFQTAEDFGNHPFHQRILFAVSLFLQCLKRDFLRFGNGRAGDPTTSNQQPKNKKSRHAPHPERIGFMC